MIVWLSVLRRGPARLSKYLSSNNLCSAPLTNKGPFRVWCVDLVTKLEPPGPNGETICITAVDPFTKFVLADPLTDRSSASTMRWLNARIVSFFGVPYCLRVD